MRYGNLTSTSNDSYLAYLKSETQHPRLLVGPRTRDPDSSPRWIRDARPRTLKMGPKTQDPCHRWDSGPETQDPKAGTRDPVAISWIGTETLDHKGGTQYPKYTWRDSRLKKRNPEYEWIHVLYAFTSISSVSHYPILRQEHFWSFTILMSYSFPVAEKTSTVQLLWNLWIFDKKQKLVIISEKISEAYF